MTATTATLSTKGGVALDRQDNHAFLLRAAIGLAAAVYAFFRFGAAAGMHGFAAVAIFILLDAVRFAWPKRSQGHVFAAATAVTFQVAVIGVLFFAPAPFGIGSDVPVRVVLDSPFFLLLLCFLASHATAANPMQLAASSLSILGLLFVIWQKAVADPLTITQADLHMTQFKNALAMLTAINDPHYFNFTLWWRSLFVPCLMITAALGLALFRTRWLTREVSKMELKRRSLAAFFSPQIVETILRSHTTSLAPNERMMAVLDGDLIGFTRLAESLPPEEVAAHLNRYRAAIEEAIFAHGGALLAHTGDGAVALFGLADEGPAPASNALRCALDIRNALRSILNQPFASKMPEVAIGIDFGPTLVGLIGEERSRSLLAIGATIDQASLLQRASREFATHILLSDAAKSALHSPPTNVTLDPVTVDAGRAWRVCS